MDSAKISRCVKVKSFNSNFSKCIKKDFRNEKAKDISVVVIGAGLAGLSATSHLMKNGFENVRLLEATERFGGRINTKHFGDVFCELGAKWIPLDDSQHSVYQFAHRASKFELKSKQQDGVMYVNDLGQQIVNSIPERIESLFDKLCTSLNVKDKFFSGNMFDLDNVNSFFKAESAKLIETNFPKEDHNVARSVLNVQIKEFSSLHGCHLDNVSIQHLMNTPNQFSTKIYVPNGLEGILEEIKHNITSDILILGKPVGIIKWLNNDNRFVGCMDGSVFNADHIICTLPLGVLKNFSKLMFQPDLPKEKENAIKNIGFGNPIKLYFEFSKSVSSWFSSNFRPIRNTEESDLIWVNQIIEISKLASSDRVIEISIGGGQYEEIEKLPDNELVSEVTKMLRKYLNNTDVPYPISILRSNWNSSACFLGGRPYFSTKSTDRDVIYLSSPLGDVPRLLFAGDATILNGFGTIDGARLSGIREAERIIKFYNP